MKREDIGGYVWSAAGIAAATAALRLARHALDTGQASLLYLPVVIACAVRFGFGPAVLGAVLGFACWDFFFLPPRYTLAVANAGDWISLAVFLGAALTTAHLASRMRREAASASEREAEIATLFQASQTVSSEISAQSIVAAIARQLQALCRASRCIVWRIDPRTGAELPAVYWSGDGSDPVSSDEQRFAEALAVHGQPIGLDPAGSALWNKAIGSSPSADNGIAIPLRAQNELVGVLFVARGATDVGGRFSSTELRLIRTLGNHAALAIARENLAAEAAAAAALRQADALKDVLLSTVSHELRSPLAAIKATAGSLQQRLAVVGGFAGASDDVAAIDVEADRLTQLVGNLLDLSRIEAGAWQPVRDWCDIAEIVGTALDRVGKDAADRVRISPRAARAPLIRGDYAQLAVVMTNLLDNAAKYGAPGSPIDVDISPAHDGQNESPSGATIRVRDYGEGISPGEETAIFGKFVRGELHRRSAVRGSGLGLALCHAIVTAHGGRIWSSNSPAGEGRGAIFFVFLPID